MLAVPETRKAENTAPNAMQRSPTEEEVPTEAAATSKLNQKARKD
jgi:hypothetical protein